MCRRRIWTVARSSGRLIRRRTRDVRRVSRHASVRSRRYWRRLGHSRRQPNERGAHRYVHLRLSAGLPRCGPTCARYNIHTQISMAKQVAVGHSICRPFSDILSGLPQYANDPTPLLWLAPADTDRMEFEGAQLVPLCTIIGGACGAVPTEIFAASLEGWRYYRLLIDRTSKRFFWSPDLKTWRVEDPSGAVSEFGVPRSEPTYANATDTEDDPCTAVECPLGYRPPFRWNLVKQWDAQGETSNPVSYRWMVQSRGYLSDIFDTPPASLDVATNDFSNWAHHVHLDYVAQPFQVLTGGNKIFGWHESRLSRVVITGKDFAGTAPRSEVRLYELAYSDALGRRQRLNSPRILISGDALCDVDSRHMQCRAYIFDSDCMSSACSSRDDVRISRHQRCCNRSPVRAVSLQVQRPEFFSSIGSNALEERLPSSSHSFGWKSGWSC